MAEETDEKKNEKMILKNSDKPKSVEAKKNITTLESVKEKKPEIKKEKPQKKSFLSRITRKKEEPKIEEKEIADPFKTIRYVLMTEKSIQMIEAQNKLTFIVNKDSDKKEIKKAIESLFETKIVSVQTMFDQKNRKKAIVKFKTPGIAGEIAVRLGII